MMAKNFMYFDGSVSNDNSSSTISQAALNYIQQQLAPVFVNQTGDIGVGELQTAQTSFTNSADLVSKLYVDKTTFEPPIISSQNPYFHFCADAYGTSESSIFDISANNRSLTFVSDSSLGGSTSFNSNLNNHKYVTFTNRGFKFNSSDVNVYTCFAVVQYFATNTISFVFGGNSLVNGFADFHDGSFGGSTPLVNAIIAGNYATPNSYNNFYYNGIKTNASTTLKNTNWFLYAFTSSTPALSSQMFIDRNLQGRFGGANLAEAIVFTSQLSSISFAQISDYLLSKYGIQYNNYLRLDGTSNPSSNISMNNQRIINVADPVNLQDVATRNYVLNNRTVFEPQIISSQNPYFHFCADAYGTSESSIFDISSNNQTITFLNYSNVTGTTTFTTASASLNYHRYITLTNRGFTFNSTASNVNIYTCFAVIQYNAVSTPAFVFGLTGSTSASLVDFHDGSIVASGYLVNAFISGSWATPNSYNNFYYNGVSINASTTLKNTNWFLYAFTSSTPALAGAMFIDRGGQFSSTSQTRYGGASLAEAIVFTSQLSNTAFVQITDYLLAKYNIQYNAYDSLAINNIFGVSNLSINTSNYSSLTINLNTFTSNNNINNSGTLSCNFSSSALPTYNSNPLNSLGTLNFNGTSQYLQGNVTQLVQASCTCFAVARTNSLSGNRRIFAINNDIAFGTSTNGLIFTTYTVKDYITASTSITANTWNIIVYRFNANFSVDFALNGSSTYENISGTSNVANSGTNNIYLGCGYSNSGTTTNEYWSGDIAGVYVLNVALTNPQIDQFVGMLANQFGLQSILPPGHTYKLLQPIVRSSALNMNNYGITGLPINLTDLNGAINLLQFYTSINVSTLFYATIIVFGTSSTNSSTKSLSVANASFSTANSLVKLVLSTFPVVTGELFSVTYSSAGFSAGLLNFTATVIRTDNTTSGWGEALELQVQIHYK